MQALREPPAFLVTRLRRLFPQSAWAHQAEGHELLRFSQPAGIFSWSFHSAPSHCSQPQISFSTFSAFLRLRWLGAAFFTFLCIKLLGLPV